MTVVGMVTDRLGHAEYRSPSWDGRAATEHRRYVALDSLDYRSTQPAHHTRRLRRRRGGQVRR